MNSTGISFRPLDGWGESTIEENGDANIFDRNIPPRAGLEPEKRSFSSFSLRGLII
jgi:hypothetical protein